MKIRIEGCTAEELAEYSPYLSLGREYEAEGDGPAWAYIRDDEGEELMISMTKCECRHLPASASWVEVTE